MAESASLHGGDLLKRGFTVAQVVHDYGGVCQAVTELADETNALITADEFHAFNRCLDDAIAQAVTEYTRQREQSISDQGTERIGRARARAAQRARRRDAVVPGYCAWGRSVSTEAQPRCSAGASRACRPSSIRSLTEVRLDGDVRAPERVSVRELLEEIEVGASMEANARELTFVVTTVGPASTCWSTVSCSRRPSPISCRMRSSSRAPMSHVSLEGFVDHEPSADRRRGRVRRPSARQSRRSCSADSSSEAVDRTGLGLGLSISRKSIEANGGEIRVRDVPGAGAYSPSICRGS